MALGNIFALDLGTTKFCLAGLLQKASHERPVFDSVSVPARGMKRGMVCDYNEAKEALLHLLDLAEKHFLADIQKVLVGVAGTHLKHWKNAVTTPLNAEITPEHLQRLVAKARSEGKHEDREILHAIPLLYKIDEREPVKNPMGFSGRQLSADFFYIDSDDSYLRDILQLCNQSGLEIIRFYSESIASASVTVSDDQKQLGVVLADIGGGTTDGVAFINGHPSSAFSVNVAGTLMTSDLAIGLNLNQIEAERVKAFFGLRRNTQEDLLVFDVYGNERRIKAKDVFPILAPRIYELAEMLANHLKPFKGQLGAGLLLTGGGSEVHEICPFLEQLFKIPVCKAQPAMTYESSRINTQSVAGVTQFPTKLATAFGLINLEVGQRKFEQTEKKSLLSNHYVNQFLNWLKELS